MGWTEYVATQYKNGTVDRKAECDILFDGSKSKVLKSRMVGSTYYAAIQVHTPDKATDIKWDTEDDEFSKEDIPSLPTEITIPEGLTDEEEISDYLSEKTGFCHFGFEIAQGKTEVIAVVVLTSVRNGRYFGYKDMDESELPFYYNCPESILKLLTPTENANANEWRKRCREYNLKKKELDKATLNTSVAVIINGEKKIFTKSVHRKRKKWINWCESTYLTTDRIINLGYEIIGK